MSDCWLCSRVDLHSSVDSEQTTSLAARDTGKTQRCSLCLMGTGELEHVNPVTKHLSAKQQIPFPLLGIITEVVFICEDVT